MIRSHKTLSPLLLLALLLSTVACSKDEPLSATETLQAIYRARWTGNMLDRALQATAPLTALPANATLEDAETHIRDLFTECAELVLENDTLQVEIDADCATEAYPCVGSYQLTKVTTDDDGKPVDGFKLTPDELDCGDQALTGSVAIHPLVASDGQPYSSLLRLKGLEHSDSRQNMEGDWVVFPAAKDFHGAFYLRTSSIETPSEDSIALTILAGTGTYSDVELGLAWETDAQDLGMKLGVVTPRSGGLQLRSTPGSKYVFQTNWVALSKSATRVTVKKEKQQWVGCISDGDAKECERLGY